MHLKMLIKMALLYCVMTSDAFAQDLGPTPAFPQPDMDRVLLGQLLFYDPILSGNRNISCATCHHPKFGTSDGVSLSIGEGGIGLGPERIRDPKNPPEQRIPRNASALWNLGATEFVTFFHDGRLEADPDQPNGIRTPLGSEMSDGFQSALAAQAMFPVLSADEMAGHYTENDISRAVRQGFLTGDGGAWQLIAKRVADIPEYAAKFSAVAPNKPITFAQIANVIADFISFEWRADNSPFDKAMRGEAQLKTPAKHGQDLFYGKAKCASCHSGWFQTDHKFHSIALPQIGPGKSARFENHRRDDGRLRVTGNAQDVYKFRTPSLRNVTLTAPYGHNGAFADLEDMVRHHLDPVQSLRAYSIDQAVLADWPNKQDIADPADTKNIAAANQLSPINLTDEEIDNIIEFLGALEDNTTRLGVPTAVPSGSPLD